MASLAPLPPTAGDVCRGVSRLLYRSGVTPLAEVPLGNGRRADLVGLDAQGRVTLIEVKISMADLRGDLKWPEYLDFCDRFLWAVPAGFPLAPFDEPWFRPERCGLIVADRWDAAEIRPGPWVPLAPARRKAETLRFARRAAQRILFHADPGAVATDLE